MKKTKVVLSVALAAAVAFTGCTKKGNGSHANVVIKFPTATASGALYAVGAAITNMWDTNIDFVSASSQPSNGGLDNLNQIADGESQVSIAISSNCFQSYYGLDTFEGYWYCDVGDFDIDTENDEFTFIDLLADVIVYPSGEIRVVDLAEAADIFESGKIDSDILCKMLRRLDFLLETVHSGEFANMQKMLESYE